MTERGQKIRETFLKKYGVEHPSQLPSVKEKIRQKRMSGAYSQMVSTTKKTLKEKYGDENYNNKEKGWKTKLQRYGDKNYNNREQFVKTNQEKYGMKVSPNTLKRTTERAKSGEIGFKSQAYQKFLKLNGITNISQLPTVKTKKQDNTKKRFIHEVIFGNRLKGKVIPLFSESEYKGTNYHDLYKFQCAVCQHEFEDNLYSGNIPRCLVCYPHVPFQSKVELEIRDFIISQQVIIKNHDRTILNGNEIDILIPDKRIGIECDGIIWHSEIFGKKDKSYHLNKTKIAADQHISLLHIWDWEWLTKTNLIKSMLLSKLNKSEKVHARKCKIVELSGSEKSIFLKNNHIQGDDKSSVRVGLINKNELIMVMTFVKSRFDKKYQYEISRFCNQQGKNIIGGASKLFQYFLKTRKPTSIVSYCDRRFFTGDVYNRMGMILAGTTPPNYHYFHKNSCIPIHRIAFQKHKLRSILKTFDPELTEWENMQMNGYDRIWDCGNFKFIWKNT